MKNRLIACFYASPFFKIKDLRLSTFYIPDLLVFHVYTPGRAPTRTSFLEEKRRPGQVKLNGGKLFNFTLTPIKYAGIAFVSCSWEMLRIAGRDEIQGNWV